MEATAADDRKRMEPSEPSRDASGWPSVGGTGAVSQTAIVASRGMATAAAAAPPAPKSSSGGGNTLCFCTDEAPALRLSPTMVLVMSLCFIGFFTALHGFGKIYNSRWRPPANTVEAGGGHAPMVVMGCEWQGWTTMAPLVRWWRTYGGQGQRMGTG
nr:unnamed protein product [Digitaria exilis]